MTHASDRQQRRKKRKRWQQRGGGGVKRVGRRATSGGTGALSKLSPFWQTIIGIVTLGMVVAAVVMIVWGIFFV